VIVHHACLSVSLLIAHHFKDMVMLVKYQRKFEGKQFPLSKV